MTDGTTSELAETPANKFLTTKVRGYIYVLVALIGVAVGATQTAFLAIGDQPSWLTVTIAVYTYIAAAFGFTARVFTK